MVADNSDNLPHYDAALALHLAYGVPVVRDEVINGLLELFADGGDLALLFDVSCYRSNPTRSYALVHRAVGLARQAAMLRLQSLCKELETALEEGEFVTAEELGGNLPATVASARAAVAAESQVQPGILTI